MIETTLCKETFNDKSAVTLQFSDFREHSRNSLNEVESTALKQLAMVQPAEGNQSHNIFRESEEHSLKSRVNPTVTEVHEVQQMVENTEVAACQKTSREYREDSQNSLTAEGKNVSVPKLSWINSMTQIVGLAAAWQQGKVEGNLVGTSGAGGSKTNKTSVHGEFNFFL